MGSSFEGNKWLWEVFSDIGQVVDVYISRKFRKNNPNCFAFVRFGFKNHVSRAIHSLNGSYLDDRRISVSEAKYGRCFKAETLNKFKQIPEQDVENYKQHGYAKHSVTRTFKNALLGEKNDTEKANQSEPLETKNSMDQCLIKDGTENIRHEGSLVINKVAVCDSKSERRKEVIIEESEDQQEVLRRSIIGSSVKEINLPEVLRRIRNEWKGSGKLWCRDIGPYKCLLTFDSEEIKAYALEDQLILSLFDEVTNHPGLMWSHSRRVWIELTGFPIHLWSRDAFENVSKVWGKFVMEDFVTKECFSFTAPRILVDSYQWEPIQEWLTLKVKDRVFEVYAREFGRDVYSVQAHPEASVEGIDESDNPNMSIQEVSVDHVPPARSVMIGAERNNCSQIQHTVVCEEDERNIDDENKEGGNDIEMDWGLREEDIEIDKVGSDGLQKTQVDGSMNNPNNMKDSSSSCPFPPGFGPCSPGLHLHGSSKGEELEMALVDKRTHTHYEGHETNACNIDEDDEEIQQTEAVEREQAIAAKNICEDAGMEFGNCDEEALISSFINKANGKSRNIVARMGGFQGRKKVRLSKTFGAKSGKNLKSETHTQHEGHDIDACPIEDDKENQQPQSVEGGRALTAKERCKDGDVNFEDSNEDVLLSALMTKSKVKSKNKSGVEGGNQGRKKVRNSKSFSASSGKILKSGVLVNYI